MATRIGLALFTGDAFTLGEWSRFMAVGLMFDLVVVPCFLLPWALYDAVLPKFVTDHPALSKWEDRWAALWAVLFLTMFAVMAASEFTFWAEFNSRFDFVAVDYLIYTTEVLGNIWQSYPIVLWMSAIIGACLVVAWISWPRGGHDTRSGWAMRWLRAGGVAAVLALGMGMIDQDMAEADANKFVQQLSTNGPFAFGHAFWHNELDYGRYYPTMEKDALNTGIRALTRQSNSQFTSADGIERQITAHMPPKKVNIVLISMESFSADYMGLFGNNQNLSPELDKLAGQGLLFTQLYATGTRTVRGLEALSVGTPPTPGQSIVRRPNNGGLENLGAELKEAGWKPYWIYGGYGFFDNMNAYFDANGYTVVDRADMESESIEIHHENIWGVADEDLYSLAMAKMDREYAAGNLFFTHIMTTSNHRPYTFPEGRIDLRQKYREGAVKYTDWAVGDFIRRSAEKPWFKNTLFIITSDHTAKAAGKTDLPTWRYLIPMIWYAPDLIEPAVMDRLMSQIDIPTTLMGWLGLDYRSRFFGYDMFNLEAGRERAFISTYQKLGLLKADRLVVLDLKSQAQVLEGLPVKTGGTPAVADADLIAEAISWYQAASLYFNSGQLKNSTPSP